MGRREALSLNIIAACLEMNRSGLNQGKSGNISCRFKQGCLITPSGISYEELEPEDIVWLGFDGTVEGTRRPSSEWRMHLDIYRRVRSAKAVVHAHPAYATALSCQHREIPPFHYMVAVAGGQNIRCAPYATFGTAELSDNMLQALKGRSACLLANHGMIAYGKNLADAMWRAGEVEALAKQYHLSLTSGEPVLLTAQQIKQALTQFKDYGKQPK